MYLFSKVNFCHKLRIFSKNTIWSSVFFVISKKSSILGHGYNLHFVRYKSICSNRLSFIPCLRTYFNAKTTGPRIFSLNSGSRLRHFEWGIRSNLFSSSAKLFVKSKIFSTLTSKEKLFKSTEIKRLLSLAKPEKWKLTGAICLLLVSSTVTMAVPFCLGKVIDIIYTADAANTRDNLNKLSGVLLVIFLVGSLCNFGRVYLMSTSGQRITQQLRKTVFGSIVRQEVAFFDINKTGELVNRLSADTTLVSNSITQNVSDGLRSSIMAVAGISMMFYTSSQLAIVGLAIVPPVAGMAIAYGRYVRKITKSVQDSLADATQVAEEKIANIRTVKMFSQEERENQMYAEKIQKVLELLYREARASSLFYGLTGLSGNIIILTVLYYGGVMVSDQHITVGNLSAFLLYAAYIGVSIGGLSSFYSELNKGLGASTRLWELIDRTPAIPLTGGLVPITEPRGHITFQHVTFRYPARPDSVILKDFTLDIKPGSVTAVVGASGSGKSTLASLLLRLYDPESGEVMLDGTPIRQIQVDWLRKHVGVVSQEPVLFSSSIKDNILYGASDPSQVTTEQLIAVTKEANAYNFIVNTFSEGFNTRVGERGVMLSGGQKQRVAIARALIKNPRILLLDEATSALDAESEHLVQEALERIMKGRTVLTIAHRLSTIRNAAPPGCFSGDLPSVPGSVPLAASLLSIRTLHLWPISGLPATQLIYICTREKKTQIPLPLTDNVQLFYINSLLSFWKKEKTP
ncbi:unnamed protein product [Timema podura]|uniref:ATP-binding cassette sub-family B member 10, mitochondrial n=1 Tax=Timema podura TaxID=61482 RepID=A0ABN7NJ57_TIMPD|nr:unnamed protein product [Timema podura]